MQKRTERKLVLQAEGDEKPGPIASFRVELHETRQARRTDRELWRDDSRPGDPAHSRTTVLEGMTREQARVLVDEVVGWLAYIETEGS